jgi:hypothetical protein
MNTTPETLFEIQASEPRRIFGSVVLGLLGTLLIYTALATPPRDFIFLLLLFVVGIVSLVAAVRGWRAGARRIVLRSDGLFDDLGAPIAPLDEIASVDRSLFAVKPARGFLVRLRDPAPRAWQPGMCGVTNGSQTKIVADALSMMVADRDKAPETLTDE